jgi:hypothetical protein
MAVISVLCSSAIGCTSIQNASHQLWSDDKKSSHAVNDYYNLPEISSNYSEKST